MVTVSGTGSTWTNSSALYVGYSGSGTLNITDGGAVSSTYGYIGYNSGSTGAVTVDGTGSTWTNSASSLRRQLWQRDAEHHRRRCRYGKRCFDQ